jgi:hypothetical protein
VPPLHNAAVRAQRRPLQTNHQPALHLLGRHSLPDSASVDHAIERHLSNDAEHQRRRAAYARRLALERRMERYMHMSFTPSGRPYDTLPIITPVEARELNKENTRNIFGALRNTTSHFASAG